MFSELQWKVRKIKDGYIRITVNTGQKPPDKIMNSYGYEARFRKDLKRYGKIDRIDLIINSPGGAVASAYGMLAALYDLKKCHGRVLIDDYAGSAATIVAFGCKAPVFIVPGGRIMVHMPKAVMTAGKGGIWATYERLAKRSAVNMIAAIYRGKCKKKRKEILEWMENNRLMKDWECMEEGLCDGIMTRAEFEKGE